MLWQCHEGPEGHFDDSASFQTQAEHETFSRVPRWAWAQRLPQPSDSRAGDKPPQMSKEPRDQPLCDVSVGYSAEMADFLSEVFGRISDFSADSIAQRTYTRAVTCSGGICA